MWNKDISFRPWIPRFNSYYQHILHIICICDYVYILNVCINFGEITSMLYKMMCKKKGATNSSRNNSMITYLNINKVPKIQYDNILRIFSISMEFFSMFYYSIA